eukprot:scaffold4022_cov122-Isochrysis_galbana.AAC.12
MGVVSGRCTSDIDGLVDSGWDDTLMTRWAISELSSQAAAATLKSRTLGPRRKCSTTIKQNQHFLTGAITTGKLWLAGLVGRRPGTGMLRALACARMAVQASPGPCIDAALHSCLQGRRHGSVTAAAEAARRIGPQVRQAQDLAGPE